MATTLRREEVKGREGPIGWAGSRVWRREMQEAFLLSGSGSSQARSSPVSWPFVCVLLLIMSATRIGAPNCAATFRHVSFSAPPPLYLLPPPILPTSSPPSIQNPDITANPTDDLHHERWEAASSQECGLSSAWRNT